MTWKNKTVLEHPQEPRQARYTAQHRHLEQLMRYIEQRVQDYSQEALRDLFRCLDQIEQKYSDWNADIDVIR